MLCSSINFFFWTSISSQIKLEQTVSMCTTYFYSSAAACQVTAPDAVASWVTHHFVHCSCASEIVRTQLGKRAGAWWARAVVGEQGPPLPLLDCMIIQCRKLSLATDKWPRLPHHHNQQHQRQSHRENTTRRATRAALNTVTPSPCGRPCAADFSRSLTALCPSTMLTPRQRPRRRRRRRLHCRSTKGADQPHRPKQ